MVEDCKNIQTCSKLEDFYNGKSIFITGAAGYLGSVLLEILLRYFPGIQNYYLLLRPKKGVDPQSRKKIIFQKRIFTKLLESNPNVPEKVHVIAGELTQPNLGISDKDLIKLSENVSIVFHCAATVSFLKSIRFTSMQNALGTNEVIKFCRKLQTFDVLVYTSTAYSNANREKHVEEKIYRLPFKAERFLNELQYGKEGEFEKLVSICKPDWPNNYTFSKCLAENVLHDTADDLPIAIIRPSIIATTWREEPRCYIEEGTGLVDFGTAVGRGFVRVVYGKPEAIFDLIPSDIVAYAHVTAAWSIATRRSASPLVVNCTASHVWKVTFGNYCATLLNMAQTKTIPKSFQTPSMTLVNNKALYWLYVVYEHYIPAIFLDAVLYLKGSKFRLYPLYRFLEVIMKNLSFFTSTTFEFTVDNFKRLSEQLNSDDKKMLNMDLHDVNLKELCELLPLSSPFYEWTRDTKPLKKRQQIIYLQTMMINFIKRAVLVFFCWLLYIIITRIF